MENFFDVVLSLILTIWHFSITQWLLGGGLSIGTIWGIVMFFLKWKRENVERKKKQDIDEIKRNIMKLYPLGNEGTNGSSIELCQRGVTPHGKEHLIDEAIVQLTKENRLVNRGGYYYLPSDNRF